jgi:putative ABC transport system permease protein
MKLLPLIWWHAWRHRGRSILLVACVAVTLVVPLLSRSLAARFESAQRERADMAPLVVGAKGGRFDLVLASLYFRPAPLDPLPFKTFDRLAREPLATAVPIHARFTAAGDPVVATDIGYFQRPGVPLRLSQGRRFARMGEAVAGSAAAARHGLSPGSTIFSDTTETYNITKPPSLKLTVVGVLAPTNTADDQALFVDLETAWLLEGFAHGHDDAQQIERPDLVIARKDGQVALSEALRTYQEVTETNAQSFHVHGSRGDFPLTAILLYPNDDRAATILSARLNARDDVQAIEPAQVVDELIAFVVRLRLVFDAISIVLAASTAALITLIAILGYRLRADELRTLADMGASRSTAAVLVGGELAALVLLGAGLATAFAWAALAIASNASAFV